MGYILSKIKNNIQKYGFLTFLKRACIKISHVVSTRINNIFFSKKYNKNLQEIIDKHQYDNIIVIYPIFDYNMPNFQRFQQMARALATSQNIVFYVTPNNIYDSIYGFKHVENNLYITNQLEMILKLDLKRVIVYVSTDTRFKYESMLNDLNRNDNVIYDYIDELHPDIVGNISNEVFKRHEMILKNEDIKVVASADKLLQDVKKYRNNNYALVTN